MTSALMTMGLLGANLTSINVRTSRAVYADIDSYNLYVGDDEVTEVKLSGTGWAYTPATAETNAVLTLNGVNLSSGYQTSSGPCAIYYKGENPLDIVLEENSVNKFSSGTIGFTGMEFNKADVSISGKGKISIEAMSYGIRYNNLVVNDADIEISSRLNGFSRNYDASTLTFNNANANVSVTDAYPIAATTLNVNNSTIVAYSKGQYYGAIACYNLNLSEGMLVMAGADEETAVIVEDVATWNRSDHWVKFAPKPVDKTSLNSAIDDAEKYYNSIKDNNEYKDFSDELSSAIDSAKEVASDNDATQSEVDDAKTTLETAVNKVKADIKDYEDTKAAKVVTDKISALPNASDVTLDDKEAIEAARAAYDALTPDQKAKVSAETLKKLTDAENALANLKPAKSQNGLPTGAIVGIVIGSIFALLLIVCLVLFILNKKDIINLPFLNKKK